MKDLSPEELARSKAHAEIAAKRWPNETRGETVLRLIAMIERRDRAIEVLRVVPFECGCADSYQCYGHTVRDKAEAILKEGRDE